VKVFISPIFVVLIYAFLLRIYNLNYNSPFLDEAQYLILGRKVLVGHWQESNPFAWVGGMPLFYPTLSAVFGFWGITGSRLLNALLGTISVYLLYLIVRYLKLSNNDQDNETSAIIAASFLAVLAVPLYLSRLAIYDMLSFTLLLAGLVLLLKSLKSEKQKDWRKENWYFGAAVFIAASYLAKYISFIIFPVVALAAFWQAKINGNHEVRLYLKYFLLPLSTIVIGYALWQYPALIHFQEEQISKATSHSVVILKSFYSYSLPVLLPAAIGALLLFFKSSRTALVLIILALTPLAVHLATNNSAASGQHSYLTVIFLLPLASYGLQSFIGRWPRFGNLLLGLLFIATFFYSYSQLLKLERAWPNTDKAMDFLKTRTSDHEKILSSQDDVTLLALPNFRDENITGIFDFKYKNLTGSQAYSLALSENFFDFVLLDDHAHGTIESTVLNSITFHYRPIYNEEPFTIYHKSAIAQG